MDLVLFVLLFVAVWVGRDYAFSTWSGWRLLAERFLAGSKPPGPRIRWQVVKFGPVPEAGVTNMIPTADGLYIYAGPLYRSFRAPLLIPWLLIGPVREVREFWWKRYEISLGGATRIRMSRRAFRGLEPFLTSNGPPNKPLERPGVSLRADAVAARAGRSTPLRYADLLT